MALTYSRQLLSNSTNGRPISVDSTSSPGQSIHTPQTTGTSDREEVYLYAHLLATTDKRVIIHWGGTATADEIRQDIVDGDGLHVVSPGLTLTGTAATIGAYCTATGLIAISGWVNRASATV